MLGVLNFEFERIEFTKCSSVNGGKYGRGQFLIWKGGEDKTPKAIFKGKTKFSKNCFKGIFTLKTEPFRKRIMNLQDASLKLSEDCGITETTKMGIIRYSGRTRKARKNYFEGDLFCRAKNLNNQNSLRF